MIKKNTRRRNRAVKMLSLKITLTMLKIAMDIDLLGEPIKIEICKGTGGNR